MLVRIRASRSARRGSLTVEMALVAPTLVMLLLGTVEGGLVMKDSAMLTSAAREGTRMAAVGATTADIVARVRAAAPTLRPADITVTMQYRTLEGGTPSAWTTLADEGTKNVAPTQSQVMVTATYPHALSTGMLLAALVTPGTNVVPLKSSLVMMRE